MFKYPEDRLAYHGQVHNMFNDSEQLIQFMKLNNNKCMKKTSLEEQPVCVSPSRQSSAYRSPMRTSPRNVEFVRETVWDEYDTIDDEGSLDF
jgi:hypothetical protein